LIGLYLRQLWDVYFKDKPDKPVRLSFSLFPCRLTTRFAPQVMFGAIVSGAYADHTLLPPGKFFTMFNYLEYPASRGRIHITSKSTSISSLPDHRSLDFPSDPHAQPNFDSGFMSDKVLSSDLNPPLFADISVHRPTQAHFSPCRSRTRL
jgi:alcohol oxidase